MLLPGKLSGHETPFQPRRKTRTTTTTQPRFFDDSNHLVLGQTFATICTKNFTECCIATTCLIIFEAPIAPIQIGIDLWFDMPIMETGLYACCLELLKNLRRSGHALPSTAFRPSTN